MALGRVRLADGTEPIGFLCEPAALEHAEDITAFGSWPAYLDAVSSTSR
jgi:allophanate hydrolase